MVDGKVAHDAFFGVGDIKARVHNLGLVRQDNQGFDQLVDHILSEAISNLDFVTHSRACDIGTYLCRALTRISHQL